MNKRIGKQTTKFLSCPSIIGHANVVSQKESEGPLRSSFDFINEDATFGESSWEKAESVMQKEALNRAIAKSSISLNHLNYIFAGDLLNQCIGTSFALRDSGTPLLGLYGACSTMPESLFLSAAMLDGGFADYTAAMASSHFCSAERQYRTPNQYGSQRTPTAQWTVTGAGACILAASGNAPYITFGTAGRIVDMGIKDANNMGAAMAPAAYDTLSAFFNDTSTLPSDYDLILTGDLGKVGSDILRDLFNSDGMDLGENYNDCGLMIYDLEAQDMHSGGSGCGCSAAVLTGHILNGMRSGKWNKVIFAGTGALLSPTSTQQGESIPSICHLVCISNTKE